MIPQPCDLGFPSSKFEKWRPNQIQAIEDGVESIKRFVGQMLIVGSGKTLVGMAQALILKSRTMFLTSTRGLQTQMMDDFGGMGLVQIKGKSNYDCNFFLGQTCDDGMVGRCPYKGNTACTWAAARDEAMNSKLVVSNYSCWLATNKYGMGFGSFDLLVMDEAHNSSAELAKSMQIHLGAKEVLFELKCEWPKDTETMESWSEWAYEVRTKTEMKVQGLKEKLEKTQHPPIHLIKEFRHFKNLGNKISELCLCSPDGWVCDKGDWDGFRFDPIDPAEYAERYMFRGIPKVVLTSGTISPRTLKGLGIPEEDFDYFEYPGKVNPGKSPLIFVPTLHVSRNSTEDDLQKIIERCDEIVEMRGDRRGIIHTGNFKMRDFIMENSRYSKYMVSNYASNSDVTSAVIKRFKMQPPPVVLVSPSVTTGYDFPAHDCRYQIIAKLPFPDFHSNKVDREREKLDPKRGIFQMWQTLAQAFGRGDRSEEDWCETIILDSNIEKMIRLYGSLAPWWLIAAYRKAKEVPLPPDLD